MKDLMKYFALPLIVSCLVFSACKKDKLDFSSTSPFGVQEVLISDNCNADCGETAECENEIIKIKGTLDSSNINVASNQFYLLDHGDDGIRMEVKVDAAISDEVFLKLAGNGGSSVIAGGKMEGFDADTNFSCIKMYFLTVSNASQVTIE